MTDVSSDADLVEITINGTSFGARPGELLIDACERAGVYVPRFCYHPRMQPVGMCRMCLVEVDSGRGPALAPSCMLTCAPGMVVDTESEVTTKAQDGVLEFLLINHPLDCPVCDKGGECPLQDQTMAYGPGESRFVEQKRHYEKPIPISDTVYLDRERCILCDRCTRFAKEVAGDPLIHFQDRGNQTQVNTFPDEPFASYFSGNTVQICPVGALTAKPYRFKARPWDLEEVESTAMTDSVGSRIAVQSSRNQVLRYLGVDADAVNWGWLSDKERFGFEAYAAPDRLTRPLRREGDELVATGWADAYQRVTDALGAPADRVAVVGGARLTNEGQYAWAKLAKGVLGTDHVDAQLGDGLPAEVVLGLPRATIDQACIPGGTIVVLGPDPKEELGALFLRLRHAVVHDGATLIELTPRPTGLAPIAAHCLHPRPGEAATLVKALLARETGQAVAGVEPDALAPAAEALRSGPVTVLVGRASLAEAAGPTVDAALALRDGLDDVRFLSLLRRGNVHGALDMGLAPGLLPGRRRLDDPGALADQWPTLPAEPGLDTLGILAAAADGRIDTLVLLGADPLADVPDRELARRGLEGAGTVIAVDLFPTDSVRAAADVVLPAAGPHEADGSFTNLEGRVSAVRRKVTPPGTARPDWIIAAELAQRLGTDLGLDAPGSVWDELVASGGAHADVDPDAIGGREGVVVTGRLDGPDPEPTTVPAADAYSLRLVATRVMYDAGAMIARCPSSAELAPGATLALAPAELDKLGVREGDELSITSSAGSVTLPVVADPGLPRGSAAVTVRQPDVDTIELIDSSSVVTQVRVERP